MGDWSTCLYIRVFKINGADFEKLAAPMEAFYTVKQHRFFIGESLESSDADIELLFVLKIYEEHGRFNRAITTVADALMDALVSLNPPETVLLILIGFKFERYANYILILVNSKT